MNTVLIVDDEEDLLNFEKIVFEMEGYEVVTAMDGDEALEKVKQMNPDVIIMDIRMPRKDGYTVCRELKANPATRRIPVILCSVLGGGLERSSGFAAGADAYLTKPLNIKEATTMVKVLMEKSGNTG